MNDGERDDYVRAALLAHGYAFSEPYIGEIVQQFARIESIAASIVDENLPIDVESASVFRP